MIKVLLDTNILVSGFVSFKYPDRPPAQLLHSWRNGKFQLILSEHILSEVERTLNTPYFKKYLSGEEIHQVLILLKEEGLIVPITANIKNVATHPEDDLILATAISAQADYLVTGDGSLLRKVGKSFRGITLLTASDFFNELYKSEPFN